MYLPEPGFPAFRQVSFLGDMPRPWIVTLPYALAPNLDWIFVFQLLLSLAAWTALLVAVSRLPFTRYGVWVACGCVIAVGLSSAATVWDPLIQSDSLAMTGSILFVAGFIMLLGRKASWWGVVWMGAGALIASQIRPVTVLVLLAVSAWLGCAALIMARRQPASHRTTPRKWLAGASLLLVVAAYTVMMNSRMDSAWGREFVAEPEVQGRTLQQVGVINMTPWGTAFIAELTKKNGYECLAERYGSGGQADYWRATLVAECPSEAKQFSQEFQAEYASWLVTHPRTATRALVPAFNEAFAEPDSHDSMVLVPGSLTMLWFAVPVTGSNPLILLIVLLSGICVATIWRVHRRFVGLVPLLLLAAAGLVAVAATVAMSPLDATRVASAPAMITRLGALLGIVMGVDILVNRHRIRSTQNSSRSGVGRTA
jgi:hypothetical protein